METGRKIANKQISSFQSVLANVLYFAIALLDDVDKRRVGQDFLLEKSEINSANIVLETVQVHDFSHFTERF